jgi:CheY-like chemotaxis protein
LSLVKLLVELHGGSISVESAGRGRGSLFTVRLPLTAERPQAIPPNCSSDGGGLRILIVEDNADSRTTLEKLLSMYGHRVATAPDGHAGLEAFRRDMPDIALLDIGLPGLDGFELARRIRAEMDGKPARLIALTGYGREEDHQAVIEAGFDEHLIKPVDRDALLRVLKKRR